MTTRHLEIQVATGMILTLNQRLHWAAKAKRTRDLRFIGWAAYRQKFHANRVGPDMDRARVTVQVTYPDKRRRDVHNLMPTLKALVDGFIDAGMLPDDDDRHLVGPDVRAGEGLSPAGFYGFRFTIEPL